MQAGDRDLFAGADGIGQGRQMGHGFEGTDAEHGDKYQGATYMGGIRVFFRPPVLGRRLSSSFRPPWPGVRKIGACAASNTRRDCSTMISNSSRSATPRPIWSKICFAILPASADASQAIGDGYWAVQSGN